MWSQRTYSLLERRGKSNEHMVQSVMRENTEWICSMHELRIYDFHAQEMILLWSSHLQTPTWRQGDLNQCTVKLGDLDAIHSISADCREFESLDRTEFLIVNFYKFQASTFRCLETHRWLWNCQDGWRDYGTGTRCTRWGTSSGNRQQR